MAGRPDSRVERATRTRRAACGRTATLPAMRRLPLLLALACLLVVGVSPALAHRSATKKEHAAIDKVIHTYIHKKHSKAPSDAKVSKIVVSTANHSYALVTLSSHKAGKSRALLHTKKAKWTVIGYGVGGFSCSVAPAKIFKDLLGSAGACIAGGYLPCPRRRGARRRPAAGPVSGKLAGWPARLAGHLTEALALGALSVVAVARSRQSRTAGRFAGPGVSSRKVVDARNYFEDTQRTLRRVRTTAGHFDPHAPASTRTPAASTRTPAASTRTPAASTHTPAASTRTPARPSVSGLPISVGATWSGHGSRLAARTLAAGSNECRRRCRRGLKAGPSSADTCSSRKHPNGVPLRSRDR
jgi:hypothetical protein